MKKRRLFGILLSLALMLTMMPALGLSLTAYADPTASVSPENSGQAIVTDGGHYWGFNADPSAGFVFDHWSYKYNGNTQTWQKPSLSILKEYIDRYSDITAHFVDAYPLWVGGTQVTSANAADILGNQTASYDAESKTLTLDGATINGSYNNGDTFTNYANIYSSGIDLTIVLNGSNKVESTTETKATQSIYTASDNSIGGKLTIRGSGSLEVNGDQHAILTDGDFVLNSGQIAATSTKDEAIRIANNKNCKINGGKLTATVINYGTGIYAGNIAISKGTVTSTGYNYGMYANCDGDQTGNVTISGGDVTSTANIIGIYAGSAVTVDGGGIKATGTYGTGIYASNSATFNGGTIEAIGCESKVEPSGVSVAAAGYHGISSGEVLIKKGIESLTASGSMGAISDTVKNEIAGTGWTDTEGKKGKASIAKGEHESGELKDYKKVQFPEKADPKPEPPKPTPTPVVNNVPVVNTTAKTTTRATTIKWTWNAVDGASKYKVAYHKVGSKKWKVKTTKKTKYVLKGQKIKGLYEYKVAAVTASGDVWSDTSCRYFKTVKARAKFSKGALKVSWKKDKGAAGYEIFIARNKKMNGAQVIQVAPTSKSYSVTGLENGRYYVKVRPMKNYNGVTYTGILCKARKVRVK